MGNSHTLSTSNKLLPTLTHTTKPTKPPPSRCVSPPLPLLSSPRALPTPRSTPSPQTSAPVSHPSPATPPLVLHLSSLPSRATPPLPSAALHLRPPQLLARVPLRSHLLPALSRAVLALLPLKPAPPPPALLKLVLLTTTTSPPWVLSPVVSSPSLVSCKQLDLQGLPSTLDVKSLFRKFLSSASDISHELNTLRLL